MFLYFTISVYLFTGRWGQSLTRAIWRRASRYGLLLQRLAAELGQSAVERLRLFAVLLEQLLLAIRRRLPIWSEEA